MIRQQLAELTAFALAHTLVAISWCRVYTTLCPVGMLLPS